MTSSRRPVVVSTAERLLADAIVKENKARWDKNDAYMRYVNCPIYDIERVRHEYQLAAAAHEAAEDNLEACYAKVAGSTAQRRGK